MVLGFEIIFFNGENIMNIAIFGDSYGVADDIENYLHWSQHLSKLHNVTNFSKKASSLYYQYNLYKNNYFNFDKIVFLITIYGHIHVEKLLDFQHITSHDLVIKLLNNKEKNFNDEQIKILEALNYYYLFLKNNDYDKLFHDLLVQNLMSNKNVLIIPTFNGYLDYLYNCALYDLHLIDVKDYGIDNSMVHYKDKRQGHLNLENNILLFEKINNWIYNGCFNLDVKDFVSSNYPKHLYF